MESNYEMATVAEYLKMLEGIEYTSIKEEEVNAQLKKYFVNQKRNEMNAKIIDSLLS